MGRYLKWEQRGDYSRKTRGERYKWRQIMRSNIGMCREFGREKPNSRQTDTGVVTPGSIGLRRVPLGGSFLAIIGERTRNRRI